MNLLNGGVGLSSHRLRFAFGRPRTHQRCWRPVVVVDTRLAHPVDAALRSVRVTAQACVAPAVGHVRIAPAWPCPVDAVPAGTGEIAGGHGRMVPIDKIRARAGDTDFELELRLALIGPVKCRVIEAARWRFYTDLHPRSATYIRPETRREDASKNLRNPFPGTTSCSRCRRRHRRSSIHSPCQRGQAWPYGAGDTVPTTNVCKRHREGMEDAPLRLCIWQI